MQQKDHLNPMLIFIHLLIYEGKRRRGQKKREREKIFSRLHTHLRAQWGAEYQDSEIMI